MNDDATASPADGDAGENPVAPAGEPAEPSSVAAPDDAPAAAGADPAGADEAPDGGRGVPDTDDAAASEQARDSGAAGPGEGPDDEAPDGGDETPGGGEALDGGGEATTDAETGSPERGRLRGLRRIDPGRAAGYVGAAIVGGILTGVLLVALGVPGQSGPASTASPEPSGAAASPASTANTEPATAAPTDGAAGAISVEGNVLGDPDAPVTIEIWSDYQCPYCSLLAHAIEPDLVRGPVAAGEVRLVYSDYVFLGQESLDAAVAARCAGRQGQYWRFHDLLFALQQGENQGTFSTQFLANIADFAGLDTNAFQSCVADSSVAAGVMADTEAGTKAGIQSTPTLVIRGPVATRVIRGFPSWSDLLLEIERSLGRAPIPSPAPSAAAESPGASAAQPRSPAPEASPTP